MINAGKLAAFDTATASRCGRNPGRRRQFLARGLERGRQNRRHLQRPQSVLCGVDLKSGEVLWTTPGGGDCTPAMVNDALAVQTNNTKVGILAGKLTPAGFTRLWNFPSTRSVRSPAR